ncbi:MAG TPA: RlpA-like double-psi beta-barrel domain-containing protein, partial [Nonomuraea sp.]|nr:RlpA-like double-psi beta-barrel domain-containing protein [Nonomuraea sp.]
LRSSPRATGTIVMSGVPMGTSLLLTIPAVSGGAWGSYTCASPTSGSTWYAVSRVGTVNIAGYIYSGGVSLSTVAGATAQSGVASWYCSSSSPCTAGYSASGMWAAAGPGLQVGSWFGRTVTVSSGTASVQVTLIDSCWCGGGAVLVDLYASAFSQLAPLSTGQVNVTASW